MDQDILSALPARLLPWFVVNARDLPWRRDNEPYHVWLSEIMLQQTRVEAVKPYYARFLERLPNIRALADCDEETLLKLWEGLGYYSRARNLAKAARQIVTEHGGVFPSDYAEIRALSGVGDYTAGAVASICYDLPEPAVDGNVLRVISRVCADDRCVDEQSVKRDIRDRLRGVYASCTDGTRGQLTQALMELGATVCVPNGAPHCECCPLGSICRAKSAHAVMRYPVRKEKAKRRIEKYTVYTLQCGDCIAVRKRPNRGLLAGLWELPHLDGVADAQSAVRAAEQWEIGASELISVRQRVHIFTHIEWHMTCVHLHCTKQPDCFTWVTKEQLAAETALPTAFRIALPDEQFL